MGTTDSAFFYDDSEDLSPSPSTHSGSADPRFVAAVPNDASHTPAALSRKKVPLTRPARQQASGTSRLPTVKLKGVILGLPESGKRTLLARLRGKDPFHSSLHDSQLLESVDEHILPYQAPSDQPTWDRIQLLVHCAEDFVQTEPPDFTIVLINPQKKRKHVRLHLIERLRRLLHMLGYKKDGTLESYPLRPLCLCLLLNFRDLTQSKTRVEESNVTMWTMEILQEYPSLDPQKLVLHCGQTSLKNCYGLSVLHHFIYQSYLFRRQYQLESDLLQVRRTQQQAKTPPIQSYDDFLAILDGKNPPSEPINKKTSDKLERHRRRQVMPPPAERPSSPVAEPKRAETPPSADPKKEHSKDALLEAFLASSDEEEEPRSKRIIDKSNYDDDDDDDDDDFVVEDLPADASDKSHEDEESAAVVSAASSQRGRKVDSPEEKQFGKSTKFVPNTTDSSPASMAEDNHVGDKKSGYTHVEKPEEAASSEDPKSTAKDAGSCNVRRDSNGEARNSKPVVDDDHSQDAHKSNGVSGEEDGVESTLSAASDESQGRASHDNHAEKQVSKDINTTSTMLTKAEPRSKIERANGVDADTAEDIRKTQVESEVKPSHDGITSQENGNLTNENIEAQLSPPEAHPESSPLRSPTVEREDDNISDQEEAVSVPQESIRSQAQLAPPPAETISSAVHCAASKKDGNDNSDEEFFVGETEIEEKKEREEQVLSKPHKSILGPGKVAEDQSEEQQDQNATADGRASTDISDTDGKEAVVSDLKSAHTLVASADVSAVQSRTDSNLPATSSTGLSAAALAAIAAAQQDFESMLKIPSSTESTKKKKKKKDKERKKDKKKKKEEDTKG